MDEWWHIKEGKPIAINSPLHKWKDFIENNKKINNILAKYLRYCIYDYLSRNNRWLYPWDDFILDCKNGTVVSKILISLNTKRGINGVGQKEKESWRTTLKSVSKILNEMVYKDMQYILLEFVICDSLRRIDLMCDWKVRIFYKFCDWKGKMWHFYN